MNHQIESGVMARGNASPAPKFVVDPEKFAAADPWTKLKVLDAAGPLAEGRRELERLRAESAKAASYQARLMIDREIDRLVWDIQRLYRAIGEFEKRP